jgi:hypothetical protein
MLNLSKRQINYLFAGFLLVSVVYILFLIYSMGSEAISGREGIIKYIVIFLFLFLIAIESLTVGIAFLKRKNNGE